MDFEEVCSKSNDKSSVWHYFLRARDKMSAKCKKCQSILKCGGGSTGGLQKHLKNRHQISLKAVDTLAGEPHSAVIQSTSKEEVPKKKAKLTDYYASETNPHMELMVSRMAALNGYSFRTFIECEDLRRLFQKSGHALPKTADTIQSIVVKEADKIKQQLKIEIQKLLKEGKKFSMSFDEWTSIRNRRYISLNLHSKHFSGGKNFKNLGLIRVFGSMPAKKCVEEIKRKLYEFGVSLETDIIAEATDGCSMMTKFGKLLSSYHQKCIAHALQLAINDVFYKKSDIEDEDQIDLPETDFESIDEDMPLSELRRLFHREEVASDNDSDDDTDGAEFSSNPTTSVSERQLEYHEIILKVKKVVKLFRKSPTKNDEVLQKYVIAEFKKEYSLICDSVTRWSSLADTLQRFLKLRSCIVKALIDLKSEVSFSGEEWTEIEQLHEILDVIKTVLEALCRRDATLLTADIAIKFALKKLEENNNTLSKKMLKALKKRYGERRLVQAATLSYLQNPDKYFSERNDEDSTVFLRPNSDEMCNNIVTLLKRVNPPPPTPHDSLSIQNEEEDHSEVQISGLSSNKEKLDAELQKATNQKRKLANEDDLYTTVRFEMALFENGGDRGRYLSQAYDHLSSIPPTSVEPERIFSAAGLLCNKIRSRLSDKSLDSLIFLRTYYNEQRALKSK